MLNIFHSSFSQTLIRDGDQVFGNWTVDRSPYIIEGTATIPKDQGLYISAGVKVKLKSISTSETDNFKNKTNKSGHIIVQGTLVAAGTKDSLVSFDRYGAGKWGSIYFDSTSNANTLKYCEVKYSYGIDELRPNVTTTGAIVLYNSELNIQNCIVAKNWRGIETSGSNLKIINSSIILNEEVGIIMSDSNDISLTNSIIWGSYYCTHYSFDTNQETMNTVLFIKHSILEKNEYKIEGLNIYVNPPKFIDPDSDNFEIANKTFYSDKGISGGKIGFR